MVTNREDIQGYAAKTVFEALQAPACHENMVKVGAICPTVLCGAILSLSTNCDQIQIVVFRWVDIFWASLAISLQATPALLPLSNFSCCRAVFIYGMGVFYNYYFDESFIVWRVVIIVNPF